MCVFDIFLPISLDICVGLGEERMLKHEMVYFLSQKHGSQTPILTVLNRFAWQIAHLALSKIHRCTNFGNPKKLSPGFESFCSQKLLHVRPELPS